MRPWALRPAFFLTVLISDFSGFDFVISSNVKPDMPRRPGDVGLNCRIAILYAFEQLDLVARRERHDRLLPVGEARTADAVALHLAVHRHRVDVRDGHVERHLD